MKIGILISKGYLMQVLEEYKKIGYFWLPNKPDNKLSGTLIINNGGHIKLELTGFFDDDLYSFQPGTDYPFILGQLEDEGFVSLIDAFCNSGKFGSSGVSTSVITINKMITQVEITQKEDLSFNSFSFQLSNLQEWLGISGITRERLDDFNSFQVNYSCPETLEFDLIDDFKMRIKFRYIYTPNTSSDSQLSIKESVSIELFTQNSKSLDKFMSISHKISRFFFFAYGYPTNLSNVSLKPETYAKNSPDKKHPEIKLYFPSLSFSNDQTSHHYHSMVFNFKSLGGEFDSAINSWLKAYKEIRPTLELYFFTLSGAHKYLSGRFLSLIQGLESFDRRTNSEKTMDDSEFELLKIKLIDTCPEERKGWLETRLMHGNEISLAKRVKNLIKPFTKYFGNNNQRSKLIRSIVDTRNYLTHYDSENKGAEKAELYKLCQKLEVIYQLQFMKVIGFSDEKIEQIIDNNYRLKQQLGLTDI